MIIILYVVAGRDHNNNYEENTPKIEEHLALTGVNIIFIQCSALYTGESHNAW